MSTRVAIPPSRIEARLLGFSQLASWVVAAAGALVLAGWIWEIPALKSVAPGLATMKANTAVGLIILGLAVNCLHVHSLRLRVAARVMASLAVLLGALTLAEYLGGWNAGIDELLFRDTGEGPPSPFPGRMSPMTALNFCLLGAALLLPRANSVSARCVSDTCAIIAGLIGFVAFAGYLFEAPALYRVSVFNSMAVHTAALFVVLAAAVLTARPIHGLAALLAGDDPGAAMVRWLLPAAVIVPVVAGWVRLVGQQRGLYGTEFGIALLATSNVVVFAAVIFAAALSLRRTAAARRASERSQRESETRFRALIEHSADAIALFGDDGATLYASPATTRILGFRSEELLQHSMMEFVRADWQDAVRERMREVLSRPGVGIPMEGYVRHKNGGYRFLEGVFTNLLDEPGVGAIVNNFRDMTERKQAEEALRESEARYHQLFAASPDAVFVMDRTGRFLDCNETAAQRYGYSRAELLQMSAQDLAAPDLREHAATRIKEALATGVAFEWRHRRKDGSELPVEISAKPFGWEDKRSSCPVPATSPSASRLKRRCARARNVCAFSPNKHRRRLRCSTRT